MSEQDDVETTAQADTGGDLESAIDDATEAVAVQANELDNLQGSGQRANSEIGHLMDVPVEVTVELGHSRMTLGELSRLDTGSLVRLDRAAHEPAAIQVNGKTVAHGEIVTIGESYGVRISRVES